MRLDPDDLRSSALRLEPGEAKDRLFAKLGLEHSSWDVEFFGYPWYGSLLDMARVGQAILRGGVYNAERLVDAVLQACRQPIRGNARHESQDDAEERDPTTASKDEAVM